MINAHELRIGNWVEHNNEWSYRDKPGPFQWSERDWYALGDSTLFLENVSPLVLSPALLERCGFEKDGDQWHKQYREGRRAFSLTYDGEVFTYQVSHAETLTVWDLHQLMNLFFALTGTELSITL